MKVLLVIFLLSFKNVRERGTGFYDRISHLDGSTTRSRSVITEVIYMKSLNVYNFG